MPTEELYNKTDFSDSGSPSFAYFVTPLVMVSSFQEMLENELSYDDTNSYPSAPVTAIDLT